MAGALMGPTVFPLNQRTHRIDITADGTFGELGPAGQSETGVWTLMWVPNITFTGTLSVVGRIAMQEAVDAGAPLVQIPYILVYHGSAPSSPRSWSYAPITDTAIIEIPTGTLSPAILFGVTSGYGTLFVRDASGGYAAV